MHDLLVSLASGGVTGAIECAVCQPFDMVKTRHQLHSGKNPSTLQSLRAIHLEGGVSRFYRGVLPELAGMVPKSMSMYAAYDMSPRWLVRHTSIDAVTTAFLAGIASGPAEAIVVQPFQVVKVRMQAKEHLGRYSSSLDCAVQMLRAEGIGAFAASGFASTIWRNVVWNSIYFGTMARVRAAIENARSSRGGGPAPLLDTLADLAAGFGCGVFATAFNAPFDVAKSRQQSQLPPPNPQRYHGVLHTLATIAREEGLGACWNGIGPKAIRMGLAGLVGLKSFELVQWMLGAPESKASRGEEHEQGKGVL